MASSKKMNVCSKILTGLVCAPFIMIFILAIVCPMRNNKALETFSEQLYEYDLPPETILVEKAQLCGNLVGNGNKMDFLAVILLKTKLDASEIKSYYFKASFKGAKDNGNYPSIEIFEPKGAVLTSHYLTNQEIRFKSLVGVEDLSDYIVIVISDRGYETWFDFRAN